MRQYTVEESVRSYKGRKICEERELKEGYCGSCSLETHQQQLEDPGSWVHYSVDRWLAAGGELAADVNDAVGLIQQLGKTLDNIKRKTRK